MKSQVSNELRESSTSTASYSSTSDDKDDGNMFIGLKVTNVEPINPLFGSDVTLANDDDKQIKDHKVRLT